ncbi:MAG: hypothetical protein MHM6MM_002571 [Cercozoa sp. M6MM]
MGVKGEAAERKATSAFKTGWSPAFHFAPRDTGESFAEAQLRHEHALATHLQLPEDGLLLDLGCGICAPAIRFARFLRTCRIVAVNKQLHQVEEARNCVEQVGLQDRIAVHHGDMCDLSFVEDGTVDGVISLESVYELPFAQKRKLLAEIRRVLRPQGRLVVCDWLLLPQQNEFASSPGGRRKTMQLPMLRIPPLIHAFDLIDLVRASGLTIDTHYDMGNFGDMPWYSSLDRRLRCCGGWDAETWLHSRTTLDSLAFVVRTLRTFRLISQSAKHNFEQLVRMRDTLVRAGKAGLMSPCYLIVAHRSALSETRPFESMSLPEL